MSEDYHRQEIKSWGGEGEWSMKIPFDQYEHALRYDELYDKGGELTIKREQAVQARELTNPYGALEFAVGDGDDFVCFDHGTLPDGRIVLHATENSERQHYIDRFEYMLVNPEDAVRESILITERAVEWFTGRETKNGRQLRMHIKGWNQDPYYWARSIWALVQNENHPVTRIVKAWRKKDWRKLLAEGANW